MWISTTGVASRFGSPVFQDHTVSLLLSLLLYGMMLFGRVDTNLFQELQKGKSFFKTPQIRTDFETLARSKVRNAELYTITCRGDRRRFSMIWWEPSTVEISKWFGWCNNGSMWGEGGRSSFDIYATTMNPPHPMKDQWLQTPRQLLMGHALFMLSF